MHLPDPEVAAREAGLRYVSDRQPGVTRRHSGRGFTYLRPDGRVLTQRAQIARIEALVIPPAWQRVWICPLAGGHLQATGFDARGRKQYRYHPRWSQTRNARKFAAVASFAQWLPAIRRHVKRDLRKPGMPRERVVACVVRLLDQAMIRIGNDQYARENHSYGLTTMHNHHARVRGNEVRFCFKGKSGRRCDAAVNDPRVARIVRRCQELPGQELFEYVDERGVDHDLTSEHVNDYLREITGIAFTAKDFRTWGGTVVAAKCLHDCGPPSADGNGQPLSQRELQRREVAAVRAAAEALGNTLATCRKFYVHHRLAQAYAEGLLHTCFDKARRSRRQAGLSLPDRAVWRLVKMIG